MGDQLDRWLLLTLVTVVALSVLPTGLHVLHRDREQLRRWVHPLETGRSPVAVAERVVPDLPEPAE